MHKVDIPLNKVVKNVNIVVSVDETLAMKKYSQTQEFINETTTNGQEPEITEGSATTSTTQLEDFKLEQPSTTQPEDFKLEQPTECITPNLLVGRDTYCLAARSVENVQSCQHNQ